LPPKWDNIRCRSVIHAASPGFNSFRRCHRLFVADGTVENGSLRTEGYPDRLSQCQDSANGGRIFSRACDGFPPEFASPVSAVQTGFDIQRGLRSNANRWLEGPQLRIGLHLADVIVDGEDPLGDGINIAARVEDVVKPGSVVPTQQLFDPVKRNAQLAFKEPGARQLKNISDPATLYEVVGDLGNHSWPK
jgi:class 3 adenylate cyclase